jgi:tripartite-type tricarboxylate transporter receptor subunit TctC
VEARHMIVRETHVLAAACLVAFAAAAPAQQYPSKPIRLVVPLAPGGPSDILARTMAQTMSPSLGQTIVVDNRTGAGGTIGTDIVAKSPPDGYTMLLIALATYTITANMYAKLPYDPRKDLAPVSILAGAPYILTVHPTLPVKTAKELVALAKARPGQLNYASGGLGTGPQLAMELWNIKTGVRIAHIPYKGTGPALTDLMAGHVQLGLFNAIAVLPQIQSGKLRALAISGPKRSPLLPNVPTISETGVSGLEDVGGHMFMVPGATPKDIVARLNREALKALQNPDVLARLKSEGAEVVASSPEEAAASIRRDLVKWGDVIRQAGIKPE